MEKIQNMNLSYKAIKWGNRNTQDYRVAAFLNSGAALSPMSAQINLDGVGRLSARIGTINSVLRVTSNPLITNTIKRTVNGHRYSEYKGRVPENLLDVL
jgi:hypothetical protein